MSFAIIIPARYGSTRLPGKPLAEIAGKTMIERVLHVAKTAAAPYDAQIAVATDDERIDQFVKSLGATSIMTDEACPTGSDRTRQAVHQLKDKPDFIVNLQGDAPFTPPEMLGTLFEAAQKHPEADVITPVHQLSWSDLDRLREKKKTTPFSGTTAVLDKDNRALWFSKNIMPAIRKEEKLRANTPLSPVYQHIGLYGFRLHALEKFCSLDEGRYEALEGLEQLRMLENAMHIQAVPIDIREGMIQSGIDSPEDITRAQDHIAKFGDPHQ